MARVRGILRMNSVPRPVSLFTSMIPLKSEMTFLTTSSPTPRPEVSETSSAVLNPGTNTSP
jgi:hypothetical protein